MFGLPATTEQCHTCAFVEEVPCEPSAFAMEGAFPHNAVDKQVRPAAASHDVASLLDLLRLAGDEKLSLPERTETLRAARAALAGARSYGADEVDAALIAYDGRGSTFLHGASLDPSNLLNVVYLTLLHEMITKKCKPPTLKLWAGSEVVAVLLHECTPPLVALAVASLKALALQDKEPWRVANALLASEPKPSGGLRLLLSHTEQPSLPVAARADAAAVLHACLKVKSVRREFLARNRGAVSRLVELAGDDATPPPVLAPVLRCVASLAAEEGGAEELRTLRFVDRGLLARLLRRFSRPAHLEVLDPLSAVVAKLCSHRVDNADGYSFALSLVEAGVVPLLAELVGIHTAIAVPGAKETPPCAHNAACALACCMVMGGEQAASYARHQLARVAPGGMAGFAMSIDHMSSSFDKVESLAAAVVSPASFPSDVALWLCDKRFTATAVLRAIAEGDDDSAEWTNLRDAVAGQSSSPLGLHALSDALSSRNPLPAVCSLCLLAPYDARFVSLLVGGAALERLIGCALAFAVATAPLRGPDNPMSFF